MAESHFTDWLLQARTLSIRYLTLRWLLGQEECDPAVAAARQAMLTTGPIPAILAEQAADGRWAAERTFYTPKYTSSHWSLTLLAELALPAEDLRLRRGAAHVLQATARELRHAQAAAEA
ncbi:MAG: hypothetical protein GX605_03455, partial [Chloroflexi bacterium]|nr:hypothetical protein [Chloroflexota bacterium]